MTIPPAPRAAAETDCSQILGADSSASVPSSAVSSPVGAKDGRRVCVAEGGRGARRRGSWTTCKCGVMQRRCRLMHTHTHTHWVHQGAWHAPPSHPNDHSQSEDSILPGCSPQVPSASQEPAPASVPASALASSKMWMAGPADETIAIEDIQPTCGHGAWSRSNVHAADECGSKARTPHPPRTARNVPSL